MYAVKLGKADACDSVKAFAPARESLSKTGA